MDKDRYWGDDTVHAAGGGPEVQPLDHGPAGVLGAPGAAATRGREHHRSPASTGEPDLRGVPVADAGDVRVTVAVHLRGAEEAQVHATPGAQVVEVLVGENRPAPLGEHGVRA